MSYAWYNNEVTLWFVEALLDDKVALDATVLEWVERYEEDSTTAMTEMVNFILRVSSLDTMSYISAVGVLLKSAQKM